MLFFPVLEEAEFFLCVCVPSPKCFPGEAKPLQHAVSKKGKKKRERKEATLNIACVFVLSCTELCQSEDGEEAKKGFGIKLAWICSAPKLSLPANGFKKKIDN